MQMLPAAAEDADVPVVLVHVHRQAARYGKLAENQGRTEIFLRPLLAEAV